MTTDDEVVGGSDDGGDYSTFFKRAGMLLSVAAQMGTKRQTTTIRSTRADQTPSIFQGECFNMASLPLARLCAVTIAAVSLAGFAAPAASLAAPIATPPANCAAMSSPYDYTQQAASKCYTTDPSVGVSVLPDGGRSYNYLQNGQVVSEPVPPAGFDILTASAAELERYGLPARPASEPDLSEWQNEFRNARFATPPPFLAEVPRSLAIPPPLAPSGVSPLYTNARFAGYSTYAGSFTAGSALYTEPGLRGVSCSSPAIAIWSGIGSSSSIFGQDGTLSLPYDNHHTFWQVWSANSPNPRASAYMFTTAANHQISDPCER